MVTKPDFETNPRKALCSNHLFRNKWPPPLQGRMLRILQVYFVPGVAAAGAAGLAGSSQTMLHFGRDFCRAATSIAVTLVKRTSSVERRAHSASADRSETSVWLQSRETSGMPRSGDRSETLVKLHARCVRRMPFSGDRSVRLYASERYKFFRGIPASGDKSVTPVLLTARCASGIPASGDRSDNLPGRPLLPLQSRAFNPFNAL